MDRADKVTMATLDRDQRTINVANHEYTLEAAPNESSDGWTAHIARYTLLTGAAVLQHPVLDARSQIHDQVSMMRGMRGSGPTADLAIADLETQLCEALAEATRLEPATRHRGSA